MSPFFLNRFLLSGFALLISTVLVPVNAQSESGLTAYELEVEPPVEQTATPLSPPEVSTLKISLLTEGAYPNESGQELVDILEKDYIYVTAKLETEKGIPVVGIKPALSLEGSSQIMPLTESTSGQATDADGLFDFAIVGGKMGLDRLRVALGDASAELMINVISLEAAGFASPESIEGAMPWSLLTKAKISYDDEGNLLAKFSDEMKANDGQKVKLAGFMVPLQAERKQTHFLLTSNPPSCFFHTPGGPAGAVEMFTEKGIEVDWELIAVEGRLETLNKSDNGSVYRLHDVVLVEQ